VLATVEPEDVANLKLKMRPAKHALILGAQNDAEVKRRERVEKEEVERDK
jgi:hypothetical protein